MGKASSFRDLEMWRLAMQIAEMVHRVTQSFPKSEVYGIASQMRRAAVSIPSNIAEGFNRRSRQEMARFLAIASGSAAELETQVELAHSFDYLAQAEHATLIEMLDHLGRMITRFGQSLRRNANDRTKARSHERTQP